MSRANLLRIAFLVLVALYPAIIYFGIRHLPVSFFAVILALLLLARGSVLGQAERRLMLPLIFLHLAYATITAFTGSQRLLLWYPAIVNFSLCAVFAQSLRQEQPLLLRLVRARNVQVSAHGIVYLYRLTAVWAIFFLLNGLAAVVAGMISMEVWALYNGFLAYLLIAVLMAGEWLFRGWYKRRRGL